MSKFSFHTELFGIRTELMASLTEAGFDWFTDYMSVDLDHESFGFDICGIPDEETAREMMRSLMQAMPGWAAG